MRASQAKYEETLAELEKLMMQLNDREGVQLNAVVAFLDAQYNYHVKAAELLRVGKTVVAD